MIQQNAEGKSTALLMPWPLLQPGLPSQCAFWWGAQLGHLHDSIPALVSPSPSGCGGRGGVHGAGSAAQGWAVVWGWHHLRVCPGHGFGVQHIDERGFYKVFKAEYKETPSCLWFIAFEDIQPFNPDHPKAGKKRRFLIHIELIASIEINSIWGSKYCLHIVTPSVEYTVKFRLWLRKHLKAEHMFWVVLKIPQPMGYLRQHECVLYNAWILKEKNLRRLESFLIRIALKWV